MNTVDDKFVPYGVFVLRLGLGSMWIAHALLKYFVFTIPGLASWLSTQGLPAIFAWPLFIMELVGGTAILLGLYGRQVSLLLILILLGATWIHFANGWVFSNQGGGWEYPIFLVIASLAYALMGDGVLAIKSRRELIR